MAGIVTFSRYLLVGAIIVGSAACALPTLAADGGYDGVLAPAATDDAQDKAPAAPETGNEQAPGYSGVVSGPTPSAPAQQTGQISPIPNSAPTQDLRVISMVHDLEQNNYNLNVPLSQFGTTVHNSMAGKPAEEYVVTQHIAQAMASVNDTSLSNDARIANAQKAYKNLSAMADGLRYKQAIPDGVYKRMNLTDAYINDEKAGNTAALVQLDAALATLKTYQ